MRGSGAIDRAILVARKHDPLGADALSLRYRSICPLCSTPSVTYTDENAVTGLRSFHCRACHWSATVSEADYQGDPAITLRAICEQVVSKRPKPTARRPHQQGDPPRCHTG